jgi:hypothetical protein
VLQTKTVERYAEQRRQAEAFSDYGLAAELVAITSDEARHREETDELLCNLGA